MLKLAGLIIIGLLLLSEAERFGIVEPGTVLTELPRLEWSTLTRTTSRATDTMTTRDHSTQAHERESFTHRVTNQ